MMLTDKDGEFDPCLFNPTDSGKTPLSRACVLAFSNAVDHFCAAILEATRPHTQLYLTKGNHPIEFGRPLKWATADFLSNREGPDRLLAEQIR